MRENQDYQSFFKEEIYGKFVSFLIDKLGSATCIALLLDEPLFTKKGVHIQFRRLFNEFLSLNPQIEKMFSENSSKTFTMKNIVGENLAFPVDVNDDNLMIREELRLSRLLPPMDAEEIPRVNKMMKNTSESMKNQVLRGSKNDKKFFHPINLTLHYKRGYAMRIKHTTETFKVESKEEIMNIVFTTFENKVAYATYGKNRLTLVRPRTHVEEKD